MAAPIGLQLYSIREHLATDFEGGVRSIADMGYASVEPAGFPGTTPEKAGALFRELGLTVSSAHAGIPVGDAKQQTIDAMNEIGCKRIISGRGADSFKTLDLIKESCEMFNEASRAAVENGMTYGIHNHWWEFLEVDGRPVYQTMLELLEPEVFFEIDTYWVKTAGADPAAVIRELGSRVPLLHIKDGPCEQDKDMTAVGDGVMDFHSIVEAADDSLECMVVELDRCATDMMEAVRKSYEYLTSEGLAEGK